MHHSWTSLFDSTQNRVHVHFAQKSKALFEGMKHTNSLTIFAGTSTFAITPLSFSPPMFINFSLVVMSVRYQALPAFPYCKRQKLGKAWERSYQYTLFYWLSWLIRLCSLRKLPVCYPMKNVLLSYYRQWSWCLLSMWSACWCQIWTLWPCSHV